MLKTGITAELQIVKTTEKGLILDGGELGEIFLPMRNNREEHQPGSRISVFLFNASDGEPAATLRNPKIQLEEFASLNIVSSTRMGAFADWGLSKDLYIPVTEQQEIMQEGRSYIIRLIHDKKDNRLIGTSRISAYLDRTKPDYKTGEKVRLLIQRKTDLGWTAIINNSHTGMLYSNELFKELHPGILTEGFIQKIRDDGKIDLRLTPGSIDSIEKVKDSILKKLQQSEGRLPFNDKSPAALIYEEFGESKKNFKKAIGALYRERQITIEKDGIRLNR